MDDSNDMEMGPLAQYKPLGPKLFPPHICRDSLDWVECVMRGPPQGQACPTAFDAASARSRTTRRGVSNALRTWVFDECMRDACKYAGNGTDEPCEFFETNGTTTPGCETLCKTCDPRNETCLRNHCNQRANEETIGLYVLLGVCGLAALAVLCCIISKNREKLLPRCIRRRFRGRRAPGTELEEDAYHMKLLDVPTAEGKQKKRKRSPSPQPRVPQIRYLSRSGSGFSSSKPRPATRKSKNADIATLPTIQSASSMG